MGVRKAGAPHKRRAGRKVRGEAKVPIEQYDHKKKPRLNNPPVGLVNLKNDRVEPRTRYQYDPHLDPVLNWSGKAERLSFDTPTVSLHVHERIDARTIIETVRKTNTVDYEQISLFNESEERRPLREEVEFYKHRKNWSNRLIAGDSLLVMNSLLAKEGLAEKVQMIYFDPPYGIKYGSNFQPFVGKREVKDGKDEDLTAEPEMLRAFRDTWELGIHSYLSYLRDRLYLARQLLAETGSCFVQISDENVHLVRVILDEIFGKENFISQINFMKTGGATSSFVACVSDIILWYGKNKSATKYRPLFEEKNLAETDYDFVRLPNGEKRRLTKEEKHNPMLLPKGAKIFGLHSLKSSGFRENTTVNFKFKGKVYHPGPNNNWKTTLAGMEQLAREGRIEESGNSIRYVRYFDDFPYAPLTNHWSGGGASNMVYVVQTSEKPIMRCMLMTTDPGDLVFDPTCGSGTTAVVAENWGRRWITCDTSRVAITIAKQRLMTKVYEYFKLARPDEGVDSGFVYKRVPHVTLKSIALKENPEMEDLYDQPVKDVGRVRVTGPFTVEAVPAPVVKSLSDANTNTVACEVDQSISRSGETARQSGWRDELFSAGIRAKSGNRIEFSRVEPLPGYRWLHALAETKSNSKKVAVSFGPDHAPLDQRQVELAIEEAQKIVPQPEIIVFCAFQFDPEAAKDIDELHWEGVQILKTQMNPDLFTSDLKKKKVSNESFWLVGQPDVDVTKVKSGEFKGMYQVEVKGFDYYNPKTGEVDSGGAKNIAVWHLDTDYDGRSLFPRQVFFPIGGANDGWKKLAKSLKSEIDEELISQYERTTSVPFEPGEYNRVAVKIVDDRGIESLRIVEIP